MVTIEATRKNDGMITIEAARVNASMTQEELSKKLGWTLTTYLAYEKYRRFFRIDKAYKFSEIVNQNFNNIIFLPIDYTSSVIDGEEGEK